MGSMKLTKKEALEILIDHISLSDTWTLFYLQENSSSGGCLGTQPVTLTLMHQAMIFPKGSTR